MSGTRHPTAGEPPCSSERISVGVDEEHQHLGRLPVLQVGPGHLTDPRATSETCDVAGDRAVTAQHVQCLSQRHESGLHGPGAEALTSDPTSPAEPGGEAFHVAHSQGLDLAVAEVSEHWTEREAVALDGDRADIPTRIEPASAQLTQGLRAGQCVGT